MIAEAHRRALANRQAAIRNYERFDYTIPAETGSPCCRRPNPALHALPASGDWTPIGFGRLAPSMVALWGNLNRSAIALADESLANISINFKYNGFTPVADTGCANNVLYPLCSGLGECYGLLSQHCNSTRADLNACRRCVAAKPWVTAGTPYPSKTPWFPDNATCSASQIETFCSSAAPLPRDTSASTCSKCTGALGRTAMQCSVPHTPVTKNGTVLSCFGCSAQEASAFCSGLSKREITHDYCFSTRSRNSAECQWGFPLEQSHLVRSFSLFDPASPRVRDGTVAGLSNRTAGMLRELFWAMLEAQTIHMGSTFHSHIWAMYGSENIDTSQQGAIYIALDALARLPEYINRTLPDGKPLAYHLDQWEQFWYDWLKARATSGLFVELAAAYWPRTWPNIFNLVDLPSSDRVRLRAKMFADIAMVEAEQASVAGVRGGQKSRAKRDEITANMYPVITPALYGTNLSHWDSSNTYLPGLMNCDLPEPIAGGYLMSNVSVLIHQLGASSSYLMRNRIIGQINHTQQSGTVSFYTMRSKSDQVHTIWKTPSYLLGGVVWSPNDAISANSQQRWVGLIFGNANHTALGMHHLTGEKWGLIDEEIGIFHKCAVCHYQGSTVVDIFNASAIALPSGCTRTMAENCQANKCRHCSCSASGPTCPAQAQPTQTTVWLEANWTFVGVVDLEGNAAWAGLRSAWGGDLLSTTGPFNMALTPRDTYAPVIILTGRAAQYGTAENFTQAVISSNLHVIRSDPADTDTADVFITWNGKQYTHHAQNCYVQKLTRDGVAALRLGSLAPAEGFRPKPMLSLKTGAPEPEFYL